MHCKHIFSQINPDSDNLLHDFPFLDLDALFDDFIMASLFIAKQRCFAGTGKSLLFVRIMTPKIFRTLLVISFSSTIFSLVIDLIFPSLVPSIAAKAVENEFLPN